MTPRTWPCPAPGGTGEEFALVGEGGGASRVLIVPALFEEANRTRRFLVETMRALAAEGIASALPDLPGCNESLAPLALQTLASWREAMARAADHFAATHVLTLRGGAVFVAPDRPGWRIEPHGGPAALRALLRARIIAAREAGRAETIEGLLERGREAGLELAGYRIGAEMISALESAEPDAAPLQPAIALEAIGTSALWLRSEPGEDPAQSAALARLIADGIRR